MDEAERIRELEMKVSSNEARMTAWEIGTLEQRKLVKEYLEKIMNHVEIIDNRCQERSVICASYDKHVKDSEKQNSIWSDRKFQVSLLVMGAVFTVLTTLLLGFLNHSIDKIRDTKLGVYSRGV